jgi:AraC-like DNA-binding protein
MAQHALLAQGLPIKAIAGKFGLPCRRGSATRFERRFGMAPSLFREMHRAA